MKTQISFSKKIVGAFANLLLFGFLTGALPLQASVTNPLIRDCQISGGEFVVTQEDMALCKFGQSYLGAQDVVNYKHYQIISDGIKDFLGDVTYCKGEIIQTYPLGQTNPNQQLWLCLLDDKSIIDIFALARGPLSPRSAELVKFLESK